MHGCTPSSPDADKSRSVPAGDPSHLGRWTESHTQGERPGEDAGPEAQGFLLEEGLWLLTGTFVEPTGGEISGQVLETRKSASSAPKPTLSPPSAGLETPRRR